MSTRCHIIIEKADNDPQFVYHHCDGYPEGVGCELVEILKEYDKDINFADWDQLTIIDRLIQYSSAYERDEFMHGDEDYIYRIDCEKHTLRCFEYHDDDFGQEVDIPANIYGVESVEDKKDSDIIGKLIHERYWDAYFKIVAAMIPCYVYESIPDSAAQLLNMCIDKLSEELPTV